MNSRSRGSGTLPGRWRREDPTKVGYGLTDCPGIGPVRWAYDSGVVELTAYDVE